MLTTYRLTASDASGSPPADAEGKVPTGIGYRCTKWPDNPAWRFVAVGIGHDVDYWTEFLRALAEVDPDMAVNIEHEDADYSRLDAMIPPIGRDIRKSGQGLK